MLVLSSSQKTGRKELTKRVESSTAFNRERSELISRTESARSFEGGAHIGYEQSDVVSGTKWLLSPDPCPICISIAQNTNEVPLGGNFANKGDVVAGSKLDYEDVQHAPAHPRCRCSTTAVLK